MNHFFLQYCFFSTSFFPQVQFAHFYLLDLVYLIAHMIFFTCIFLHVGFILQLIYFFTRLFVFMLFLRLHFSVLFIFRVYFFTMSFSHEGHVVSVFRYCLFYPPFILSYQFYTCWTCGLIFQMINLLFST